MSVCAAIALTFLALHGLRNRFPPGAVKVAGLIDSPQQMRAGTCFITSRDRFDEFRPDLCMQIDPQRSNYLLLGDSHSAALWYGLAKQMPGANILQASASGCTPVLGTSAPTNCARLMRYIFGDFLLSHSVRAVFITARWSSERDFETVRHTIEWCTQHKIAVFIFGPVMEYDAPLPKLLAFSIAFNQLDLTDRHMRRDFFALDKAMQQKAENGWKVHYVSIIDAECVEGHCLPYADLADKIALMVDDNHLSNAGSMLVVRKLLEQGKLPSPDGKFAARGAVMADATNAASGLSPKVR
jgi:hypothetical protein